MHSSIMSNRQLSNADRLQLLSILDGTHAIRNYTCDASKVEVLAPRPLLPPQAFQNILSDFISSETTYELSYTRALLTPSVEVVTERSQMWMCGPIGTGRPSLSPRTPSDQSPTFSQLDFDFAHDNDSNHFPSYSHTSSSFRSSCPICLYLCPHTAFDSSLGRQTAFNSSLGREVFQKYDPLSIPRKHRDEIISSPPCFVKTSRSFFGTPEDRFWRYGLLYKTLSKSDLRPPAQKNLCRLLLGYGDCWGVKTTIYAIMEALVDYAIQSGYPENYNLLSLCRTLRIEIGDKWPNRRGPNVYQEYLSECSIDIFREAWVNLIARGPRRHNLLYRFCAFYAQLYLNRIITLAQFQTCFEVANSDSRPPLTPYYLTSGDMTGFKALSVPL